MLRPTLGCALTHQTEKIRQKNLTERQSNKKAISELTSTDTDRQSKDKK